MLEKLQVSIVFFCKKIESIENNYGNYLPLKILSQSEKEGEGHTTTFCSASGHIIDRTIRLQTSY